MNSEENSREKNRHAREAWVSVWREVYPESPIFQYSESIYCFGCLFLRFDTNDITCIKGGRHSIPESIKNGTRCNDYMKELENEEQVWMTIVDLVSECNVEFYSCVHRNPELGKWSIICWLMRNISSARFLSIERLLKNTNAVQIGIGVIESIRSVERCIREDDSFREAAAQLYEKAERLILI